MGVSCGVGVIDANGSVHLHHLTNDLLSPSYDFFEYMEAILIWTAIAEQLLFFGLKPLNINDVKL
jgi:hypothetical protein